MSERIPWPSGATAAGRPGAVRRSTTDYELGEFASAERVQPGTSLLVAGPPMSGKAALIRRMLAYGLARGNRGIVVTLTDPAPVVLGDLHERVPEADCPPFGVVDATPGSRSAPRPRETEPITDLSSPADLTGLGIAVSEWLDTPEDDSTTGVRAVVDSLEPMLVYSDRDRVLQFLHTLTARIRSAEGLGLFAVNPDSHNAQTFSALKQFFDGVLTLREDADPDLTLRDRTA